MIVGIDYDGTITDTNSEKSKWIKANLAKEVPRWECDRTDCLQFIELEEYERMANYVFERESTLISKPVPGAIKALELIVQSSIIYIITARPPHRIAYAEEWLLQYKLDSLITGIESSTNTSKKQICEKFGVSVLIDDDYRHLKNIVSSELRCILLQDGRPNEPKLDKGFEFCRSWGEVLRKLNL